MPPVNRLATPLPQSVLDRYHAEHPEEGVAKAASHVVKVKADSGGTGIVKAFDTPEEAQEYAAKFPDQSRVEIVDTSKTAVVTKDAKVDFDEIFEV